MQKEDVERALCMFDYEDKDALKQLVWLKAVDFSDPDAMAIYGWCFHKGWGVDKDEAAAVRWINRSAQTGNELGIYFLAVCLMSGIGMEENPSRAASMMTNAAERGSDYARFCLAGWYSVGKGVPKDEKKAYELMKEAARNGFVWAENSLGVYYSRGTGTVVDDSAAIIWYRRAAEHGNPLAMISLGNGCITGNGVPYSLHNARLWFERLKPCRPEDANRWLKRIDEMDRERPAPQTGSSPSYSESSFGSSSYSGSSSSSSDSSSRRALQSEEIYRNCAPAVFKLQRLNREGGENGFGSGFIVRENGTALTCWHVIQGASDLIAIFENGKTCSVSEVLNYNEIEDWAVLRLNGSGPFRSVPMQTKLTHGEITYAIGTPKGMAFTIAEGLLSNPSREVDGAEKIQTSTPTSPGSSGGVLLNKFGEAIGITCSTLTEGQNLNFAVPMSEVRLEKDPERAISVDTIRKNNASQPTPQPQPVPPSRPMNPTAGWENLKLESREYYKVKTPLINRLKRFDSTPRSLMYVEELLERNALPDWDLRHTGGFEEIVASLPQDSPLIAVMSMLSPILKNMSETLRMAKTDKESDYYFYVNILLYAVGLYTTVLIKDKGLLHRYPIYDILCFVLNVDDLNDLIRQFTPVMLEECCDYLPLALDTWPELKQRGQCKETDDMDRVGFYTVMYFLSFFVGLLSSSEDLKNTLRMRIACFYKWLRSNRIYLPKELQQQTRDYLDG